MVKGCSPWWENMASLGASINPLAKWLWHFFAVSIFPFSRFRCTKKAAVGFSKVFVCLHAAKKLSFTVFARFFSANQNANLKKRWKSKQSQIARHHFVNFQRNMALNGPRPDQKDWGSIFYFNFPQLKQPSEVWCHTCARLQKRRATEAQSDEELIGPHIVFQRPSSDAVQHFLPLPRILALQKRGKPIPGP